MKPITIESITQEHSDVFDNETLGSLPVQHTINFKDDAKLVIHAPRKIPVAARDRVKEELDRMQHLGVIKPVEEPTDWVSSMVTIIKPNKTRICLDPRDLNNSIKREYYPMLTIEEIVSRVPQATVFSTLDATRGYLQIPVDEKSSKLLTSNTSYGRFRFSRPPFGISSASEVFLRKMNQLFGEIEGCEVIVDDILVWGIDQIEHDKRLLKVLERARNVGLRLKKEKCKFKVSKLKYIGHILTPNGLKPDPEKVEAVQKMPAPGSKKELRRFLGMINYMGKFIPDLAQKTSIVRDLLKERNEWQWLPEHQKCFNDLKLGCSSQPTLVYYDVRKPVKISCDSSQYMELVPCVCKMKSLWLTLYVA